MSARVLSTVDPRAIAEGMPDLVFHCPGCACGHGVWVTKRNRNGAQWTWNNDLERPTFAPSLLVTISNGPDVPKMVCHSFVRDGQIQFLGDCTHGLAGQTVPLPPVD